MTEAESIALAREVINKYGADADKPSVKLAIALINGAHERDRLRDQLKWLRHQLEEFRSELELKDKQ